MCIVATDCRSDGFGGPKCDTSIVFPRRPAFSAGNIFKDDIRLQHAKIEWRAYRKVLSSNRILLYSAPQNSLNNVLRFLVSFLGCVGVVEDLETEEDEEQNINQINNCVCCFRRSCFVCINTHMNSGWGKLRSRCLMRKTVCQNANSYESYNYWCILLGAKLILWGREKYAKSSVKTRTPLSTELHIGLNEMRNWIEWTDN